MFFSSRTLITYDADNGESHILLSPEQLMLQPEPEREWEASNISTDLIGADWGYEAAAGNARLVLSWEALLCRPTVAELERHLRRLEIALNTNRTGSLTLGEALADGLPTLCTRWHALLTTCKVRRLPLEESPVGYVEPGLPRQSTAGAAAGAWGALSLSFRLTHPVEE